MIDRKSRPRVITLDLTVGFVELDKISRADPIADVDRTLTELGKSVVRVRDDDDRDVVEIRLLRTRRILFVVMRIASVLDPP